MAQRKVTSQTSDAEYIQAADFEMAIEAVGFGKFNLFLIFASIPMSLMSLFEMSAVSFILPAAQCDLNLSLEDKGTLNAAVYGGSILSAFIWGYLFDRMGKMRLLIIIFAIDGILVVLSSFAQNALFLIVTKFIGGLMIGGPTVAVTTYLSEMHSEKYRPKAPLVVGLWYTIGSILLPCLAYAVIPMEFEFSIGKYLVIKSWNLFLLLTGVPTFMSAFLCIYLPESPKFLMSVGKNEEALQVFRKIYRMNTGNAEEDYPIKKLKYEIQKKDLEAEASSSEEVTYPHSLLCSPLFGNFILLCCIQFIISMNPNTLRLWLPQIFQTISDYKEVNNGSSSSICEMLSLLQPVDGPEECFVNTDNFEIYLGSMIVSAVSACVYLLAGTVVNILGQKKLSFIFNSVSGIFALGIYFSPNSGLATALISAFISLAIVGTDVTVIIAVNIFPTKLRAFAVSIILMSGRLGVILGNIYFPLLLEMGCHYTFFIIGGLMIGSALLTLFLPKKNRHFI